MTHDLKTWLVRSVLAIKTQSLFHPESPGVRVNITRTRFGRWFKPTDFATIGEMVKHYRAKHRASAVSGSEYAPPSGSAFVRVAAIMPFFRYAVGPDSQHSPAIPYFTFKVAEKCFADVVRELPWAGARIYRRTWRGLVTVCEYRPNIQLSNKQG